MLYMDHAATSPLLPEVEKSMLHASKELFGNAASIHTPGHNAHEIIENARKKVAKLINAKPEEIIFTSGASEGNNTVIRTFAGKNIAFSPFEHPSVTVPVRALAKHVTEIDIAFLRDFPQVTTETKRRTPVTTGCADACPVKCDAISVQLANHEIGTIFPVAELAKQAHDSGAYFHTDATQAIGKIPVDVKKLNVDYLTFSAHKFGGPTGVGVLYVKDSAPLEPLILGGHQENARRAGTHNTLGIIGLATAADYIIKNNTPALYERKIRPLRNLLEKRILREIEGSETNSFRGHPQLLRGRSDEPREDGREEHPRNEIVSLPHILNISFKGAEGESIQLMLDAERIVVSTGSACAATDGKPSPVLMALHGDAEITHSSVRFSLGLDTTEADIDRVMEVLPAIIKKLQGISTV